MESAMALARLVSRSRLGCPARTSDALAAGSIDVSATRLGEGAGPTEPPSESLADPPTDRFGDGLSVATVLPQAPAAITTASATTPMASAGGTLRCTGGPYLV